MKRNRKRLFLICSLAIVVVSGITIFLILPHVMKKSAQKSEPLIGAAVPSHFAFAGLESWWQGATSRDDIALFPRAGGCFVSAQYLGNETAADKEAKWQESERSLVEQGYTVTALGQLPMSIQTDHGNVNYDLQQYSVVTAGGGTKVQGGQEYGYIPLAKGSLYVMANCETPDRLAETLPVIEVISFDATKVTAHKK